MDTLPPQLPGLIRDALSGLGGVPLEILDPETHKVYVVTEKTVDREVNDEYLKRAIDEALEDEAQGKIGPWDAEEVRKLGRRILADRRSESSR